MARLGPLVVLAGSALAASIGLTVGAPPADAAPVPASCTGAPVVVADFAASVGADHVARITKVTLEDFSAGCDGQTVVLQWWGNPAGDPSVPLTGDTLLATLDSSRDACNQTLLPVPTTVVGGALSLSLCPTGGPVADVSVHDLTLLALFVNGQSVPVSIGTGSPSPPITPAGTPAGSSTGAGPGTVSSRSGGPTPIAAAGSSQHGPSGLLPFTGADIETDLLGGLGLVLLGAVLIVWSRLRRQRSPIDSMAG